MSTGDVTVDWACGSHAAISSRPLKAVSSCLCRWVFPLPSRFQSSVHFRFQRLRKTRAPKHSGVSGVPSLPRFPEFPNPRMPTQGQRNSLTTTGAQHFNRIDAHCAACGNVRRNAHDDYHERNDQSHTSPDPTASRRREAIESRSRSPRRQGCENGSDEQQPPALREHHFAGPQGRCAERNANAHLTRTLTNGVRHHAVESRRGE